MRQPRVILVGQVCIDRNTIEGQQHTSWGSPVMHMSMYFQRVLGIQPTIITPYGPDFLPYAEAVAIYPPAPSIPKTLVYENIVTRGIRVQYCFHADVALPPPVDEGMCSLLATADILCIAPLTPSYSRGYLQGVIDATTSSCVKVLLPQGYLRHIAADGLVRERQFVEAAEIAPLFNVVILSDEDMHNATTAVQHWKQRSPRTDFIVTQNAKGASVTQGDRIVQIPTLPVTGAHVKNPIGLGDVFGAATAYELYMTHDLTRAVASGNAAARKSLTQPA